MTHFEAGKIDAMANEIEKLKDDMKEVKDMVKDIYQLLAGNPIDPDAVGLVKEHRELKSDFNQLRSEVKKYKSYFYAALTLIGMGILKTISDIIGK
jgi:uncharacterized protein (UPF0335 family)